MTVARLRTEHFIWDEGIDSWVGEVQLACWHGFQDRRGAYGSISSAASSDRATPFCLLRNSLEPGKLTASHLGAAQWAVDHAASMQKALLAKLLSEYATLRPRYESFLGQDYAVLMPEVRRAGDFKSLIGLHRIYVHESAKAGRPYVGFELGCSWDVEHGLGVMMHGARVVRVAGADTAFDAALAARHAEG